MTALTFVTPRPCGRQFRMDVGRFLRLAFVMGPKGLLATAGVLTDPYTHQQPEVNHLPRFSPQVISLEN